MAHHLSRTFWSALATLFLLPGFTIAQPPARPDAERPTAQDDAAQRVDRNYLNKKVIQLPIQISDAARPSIQEIQLYVKDSPMAKWALREKVGPAQKAFTFTAPSDGEYLFMMVTVDLQGRSFPGDLANEPPGLAVVIDTQPPTVELSNLGTTPDGQLIRCDVSDANPNLARTRVSYQGGDKQFRSLESMPGRTNAYCIPAPFTGLIRVTAEDLAGNETTHEEHISRMKGPKAEVSTTQVPVDPDVKPTKEPAKNEIDAVIVNAFGKDSAETRRPIRVLLPDIGMVLAAEKARVDANGRARFTSASIGSMKGADEMKPLRGEEIVIGAEKPIAQFADLRNRRIVTMEVRNKDVTVVLTPKDQTQLMNATFVPAPFLQPGVGETVGNAPPQKDSAQPGPKDPSPAPLVLPAPPRPVEIGFKFSIDPKTPLAELLPKPLKTTAKLPLWTNEDLAKVPELTFGQPISKTLPKHKAMELTAHSIARINHLNLTKTDGFMLAMIEQRGDLRGLPFLMGDECRTREEQAKVFALIADATRKGLQDARKAGPIQEGNVAFWGAVAEINLIAQEGGTEPGKRVNRVNQENLHRALVAALMQILMPESETFRVGLAKNLASIPHIDATRALAKLAIFAPEEEVRAAAIEGLKLRRERDYTEILMQGFRYPLPAVSKRAAEALVKLERKDLLENLVQVLEAPDPRLPVTAKRDGKELAVVRELVKVNHHRNCLLCHAPGNTDSTPEGVLKVAVPLPGEPLPKPSEGGYQSSPTPTPDILVRLDMTYLRQDFSLMMPVSHAHPWPDMQRFDFLVRTRTLTTDEAKAHEPGRADDEPGRLSPYHRAALFALRELTGRDAEPTAAAWRKLLKLPKTAS